MTKRIINRIELCVVSVFLLLIMLSALAAHAEAKTLESTSVENVFFYATNNCGEQLLLRVMPLTELSVLQHGQLSEITTGTDTGVNYYVSYTDNFPTTGYGEGKGFTVMELVDYIAKTSSVAGAENIAFDGDDVICFMATDGGGTYARSYSYTQMYGVKRYYFEDLFDSEIGWNTAWEVQTSSLDTYNSVYADDDPYYENKRTVFEGGVETCAILAYDSYAGRTSGTLVDSWTGDIANLVNANKGVTGCLDSMLDTKMALRVFFPQTEAQLMCGVRTASENFKWIYNLRLDMANAPELTSLGKVSAPEASFRLSEDGNTLYITLDCETDGASIYYSYDGAPQFSYTGVISYDVTDIDLETNPLYIFMTAVKEGYEDEGVVSACYYDSAPTFPVYGNTPLGEDIVFYPSEDTSALEWASWASALSYVEILMPGETEYEVFLPSQFTVDNAALTIRFDAADFEELGDYRMIFHAAGYASQTTTRRVRYKSPELICGGAYKSGDTITIQFPGAGEYMASSAVSARRITGDTYITVPSEYYEFTGDSLIISGDYFNAENGAFSDSGLYVVRFRNSQTTEEFMYAYFALNYTDLLAEAWYSKAVDYAISSGLMYGTSATELEPDGFMTRAMLLSVLYRRAGSPEIENPAAFADVESGAWYFDAAAWAYANGLTDAKPGENIYPDEVLTRGEVVEAIYRLFGSDETDAVTWAVERGAISGTSDTELSLEQYATRAQLAQIIYNIRSLQISSAQAS